MDKEEHYYDINGIRLHTVEAGDREGDPLIFLHGFPEFWYCWRNQLAYFADKGYRVIVPDQRGYNESSKPGGVENYAMEQLCSDIVALIHRLTDRKVVIAGHDWGGAVAWHLALQYPQLVRQLVIINMPHTDVFSQTLKTNFRQMLRSSYAAFFQIPRLPEWVCTAFGFAVLRRSLVKTSNRGTFSKTELAMYTQAWRQPGVLTAMINWYRAFPYNRRSTSGPVQLPVLLIWGKKDQFLISEMASESIGQCPDGKLELIDDATHWVHHEYPELVNALIYNFIKARP